MDDMPVATFYAEFGVTTPPELPPGQVWQEFAQGSHVLDDVLLLRWRVMQAVPS